MASIGCALLMGLLRPALAMGETQTPAGRTLIIEPAADLEAETAKARSERHRAVAARRAGRSIVMVHRGASAFGPENSIEACAAAMDYGADGVEVDLRRTRDGVLVLFHDGTLDGVTEGFGTVDQLTYAQFTRLPHNRSSLRRVSRPPTTFPALLDLVRERGMLLHLDLKESGLEEEVAKLLNAADAWDHVVKINPENAGRLLTHPEYRPLQYKGDGLYEGRLDFSPEAVAGQLASPGQMTLVDDPRVAARVLQRTPYKPQPYTVRYRVGRRTVEEAPTAPTDGFQPMVHLGGFTNQIDSLSPAALIAVLQAGPTNSATPAGDAQAARIVERAWASQRLGDLGKKSGPVVAALERLLQHPKPHPDWQYRGLDTSQAVQALARLGSTRSVPLLIDFYWQQVAEVTPATSPTGVDAPDWRAGPTVMAALGDLPCRAARKFLERYVTQTAAPDQAVGDSHFAAATRALLRQRMTWTDIAALLRSDNLEVRGTAIEECLRRLTDERELALRKAAPWALDLPRARR